MGLQLKSQRKNLGRSLVNERKENNKVKIKKYKI